LDHDHEMPDSSSASVPSAHEATAEVLKNAGLSTESGSSKSSDAADESALEHLNVSTASGPGNNWNLKQRMTFG
jgi:hypothetical protein